MTFQQHVFSFSPQVILAIGITVLTTLFLLANLSVKSRKSTDPLFYGKSILTDEDDEQKFP